jgi:hypothetical protein
MNEEFSSSINSSLKISYKKILTEKKQSVPFIKKIYKTKSDKTKSDKTKSDKTKSDKSTIVDINMVNYTKLITNKLDQIIKQQDIIITNIKHIEIEIGLIKNNQIQKT